jgi:hypothetical protein
MELHRGNTNGADDVPLFAMLMFARDTSETPKDLMNNHLREVGNSGGLEQVSCYCDVMECSSYLFGSSCICNFVSETTVNVLI